MSPSRTALARQVRKTRSLALTVLRAVPTPNDAVIHCSTSLGAISDSTFARRFGLNLSSAVAYRS